MAALFRTLYWYSAKYDCFIGAAHIKGIENGAADAVSRADFQRFFSIRPSAELSPSPIPSVLNSTFLSEMSSSQAGRDCRQVDSQFSSPEDSQSLQHSIQEIFQDDDLVGNAHIPGFPRGTPEELVDLCGGANGRGDGIQFGSIVCGRGPTFHRGEIGGGGEKDLVRSPLWIPTDKQTTDSAEAPHYDRYSQKDPSDLQPRDQRYGSLGGDHSGGVRPASAGRTGAQQADRFLGMVPPHNGVNYCDIEFGFGDDSPQDYQDRSGGQRKIPGHPPLCLPRGFPAVPCLLAPPDNGFPEGGSSRFPCFPLRGETYPSGARGDETERMDKFDWNEPTGGQWPFSEERGGDFRADGRPVGGRSDEARKVEIQHIPAISGTAECGNGQPERFSRPGRINYRERTFYRGQRQNG